MSAWELSGALLEFAESGEAELVCSILDVFLSDAQRKVDSIEGTFDLPDARRIAHSLKGAARQVGIEELADQAEKLEHAPDSVDPAAYSLMVLTIQQQWREAKNAIHQVRASLQNRIPQGCAL